jgi:hypothetical protein
VNFTSFLARWLGAGLDHHYEDRSCYPCYDISKALDDVLPRGVRRECLLLVAANYIMLAGRTLARDYHDLEKVSNTVGPDKWTRWAEKLEQVSKEESENTRLTLATFVAKVNNCFFCNGRSYVNSVLIFTGQFLIIQGYYTLTY